MIEERRVGSGQCAFWREGGMMIWMICDVMVGDR